MNIIIHNADTKQTFLEAQKNILTADSKNRFRAIWIRFAVGLFFIMLDIVTWNDTWRIYDKTGVKEHNFHIYLGIGIAYLLGTIGNLIFVRRLKTKILTSAKKTAQRLFKHSPESTITFTNQTINFQSIGTRSTYSNELITGFFKTDRFLFLFINDTCTITLTIDLQLLSANEHNEILTYLRSNCPEKKKLSASLS